MRPRITALACVLLLVLGGCASLSRRDLNRAQALAAAAQSTSIDCAAADACAQASPLRALGDAAISQSRGSDTIDYVQIIEQGQDALLARINLIRSARSSIDLQTYIFSEDDAGYLVLNELMGAARRGVSVRLLIDQMNAPPDLPLLASLASTDANFQIRLYNPTFKRAHTSPLQYAASIVCCFRRFNQRMHTKLLIVDGRVGITGGRNIQNDYYDWDPVLDFRDRDVLLAGPATRDMQRVFNAFWSYKRAVPVARLKDVARILLNNNGPPPLPPLAGQNRSERVIEMSALASDQAEVARRLVDTAVPVARAEFIGDGPGKQDAVSALPGAGITNDLRMLIETARHTVVMQTPYLVLSKGARQMFQRMHERSDPPTVVVSSNSLASTDAFPAYALSYKYKRRYLRELGFELYEMKPQPLDTPIDLEATGAPMTRDDDAQANPGNAGGSAILAGSGRSRRDQDRSRDQQANAVDSEDSERAHGDTAGPPGSGRIRLQAATESGRARPHRRGIRLLPLTETGLRISLHSKSIVIDGEIGIVGSHNFDPRSDHYNTEGAVIVHNREIAKRIQQAVLLDASPQNSWLIARRPPSLVSGINASISRVFEELPLFDFWPFRYATSYQLKPGCSPIPPEDPRFDDCWIPVGDFPGVEISFKAFATRVLTAFGAGLAPIL